MRVGRCLEPKGNGVSLGEGGEGGPGPQEAREMSSQCPTRAETTWTRTRRNGQVGHDEEGSARTEWALFSQDERSCNQSKLYELLTWINIIFCSRRINHMALEPFALILCLHVAVHYVANSKPYIPPAKQDRTKKVNPCIFVNFFYLPLGFNFSMTRNTDCCLVLSAAMRRWFCHLYIAWTPNRTSSPPTNRWPVYLSRGETPHIVFSLDFLLVMSEKFKIRQKFLFRFKPLHSGLKSFGKSLATVPLKSKSSSDNADYLGLLSK